MSFVDLLIFALILSLNAFFCAAETALTGVSESKLQTLAARGNRRATVLLQLLPRRSRVVASLLIGQNVVGAVLAVYSTLVINAAVGNTLPPFLAAFVAVLLSIALLLVFGEVIPKSLAVSSPTQFALAFAWPVVVITALFKPITAVLAVLSNTVLKVFGGKSGGEPTLTVEEIQAIARMGHAVGAIDEFEGRVVAKAAMLNDTRVREIMIPRTDIQALEIGVSVDEIRAFFQKTTFTRIPVYKGDLDDIIGILNFKEFFRHDPGAGRGFEILNYLHKPLFVSGVMFIGDMLNEMRRQRTHMAVVLDEYGGTAGLITMEDAVEMLVGRIDDEYDVIETPFERIDETTWEVDGRVTDERLVARMGVVLPPEALDGFDTAGGLALKAFGNIPAEGDSTTYHGLEITASRVRGNRVRRVRIRVLPPQEIEDAGQSSRRKTARTTNSVRPTEQPEPKSHEDTPTELVHERKDGK